MIPPATTVMAGRKMYLHISSSVIINSAKGLIDKGTGIIGDICRLYFVTVTVKSLSNKMYGLFG